MLNRADSISAPVVLNARDASLHLAQARLLEEGSAGFGMLRPLLAPTKATHLILVTRLRYEAMLQAEGGHLGSGPLEALGFYIDRSKPFISGASGEAPFGLLRPYTYFQIQ